MKWIFWDVVDSFLDDSEVQDARSSRREASESLDLRRDRNLSLDCHLDIIAFYNSFLAVIQNSNRKEGSHLAYSDLNSKFSATRA